MERSLIELVEGARSGDEEARHLLWRKSIRYVQCCIYRHRIPRDSVEEVEADVLKRMIMHLDQLRNPAHYLSWLWSLTRCAIIDFLRKKGHAPTHSELTDTIPDPTIPVDQYLIELEIRDELRQKVVSALGLLSEQERRAVILRFYEEWELDQIADELGISVNAVKCTLHHAINKLKARVANEL
jgi:RNA polymerase sigma-70 factor, ECF subfamily